MILFLLKPFDSLARRQPTSESQENKWIVAEIHSAGNIIV